MAEAQLTSRMAIFVLMAILLTAVSTTAIPHQSEARALREVNTTCASGQEYIGMDITTADRLAAGTDGEVSARLFGTDGRYTNFHIIDDPNADDFERGSRKVYFFCVKNVGDSITNIQLRVSRSGWDPNWGVDTIKLNYKGSATSSIELKK